MRVIENELDLLEQLDVARREAKAAFGNDEVYLEKLVRHARHVEVQVLGDQHGNLVHLFERDCSMQRRNQKVVERAPAPYLDNKQRMALCEQGLKLARAANYTHAGTVEFLMDVDSGEFYFIEVNPRIQVEHTVTEEITGIDLVKAQIKIAQGGMIGDVSSGVPQQDQIHMNGHALQCRVTTEDPENNFIPDYGRIRVYRGATGFGIRLDGGTAYSGALITPFYDSLLEKVTAWAPSTEEVIARMYRALREFRIRGVSTNLLFLEKLIDHPKFKACDYTTRFIDETAELFDFPPRKDRATRLLSFIGDVIVNQNPEVADRVKPSRPFVDPPLPKLSTKRPDFGSRNRLLQLGPEGFAQWMLEQPQILITDTTMRDAHQSLFATRMRSYDLWKIAPTYAQLVPQLFSLECWGGATFDVAMRFLKEDPWERLIVLREQVPNILLQMLLRASNAVGYTNYPDNVVRHFIQQAAANGIDLFRVFDPMNWVPNMRVAMDAVRESGSLCEAAICYTGDINDTNRAKYNLKYYLTLAKELEAAGAHILSIKDMAGICKPAAIHKLVTSLKQETGLPIHFHTHDTSGISAASVLAAIEAGVDAVDGAIDAMSGLTSQPNLNAICESLRGTDRDPELDVSALRTLSTYWEEVRHYYGAFESDIRAGTADVYRHEMPGGQYTNLREQARALGIEHHWPQVAEAYAEVNHLFGDVIKVTPSSKVVGDMALLMVTSGITIDDVRDPDKDIAFPESVVSMFKGELGQPPGGFPEALQQKILQGAEPITDRPADHLQPVDFAQARTEIEQALGREISETELSSYLLYPKVFEEYARHRQQFGNVSVLSTPVFFYGMEVDNEISIEIDKGKELIVRYLATGDVHEDGSQRVFFELNGQPRTVKLINREKATLENAHPQADENNPAHVAAPMPGLVVSVAVTVGQQVEKGDLLLSIEAMKMETAIQATQEGIVKEIAAPVGTNVGAKDLLLVVEGSLS